jgi:hypothetical protein
LIRRNTCLPVEGGGNSPIQTAEGGGRRISLISDTLLFSVDSEPGIAVPDQRSRLVGIVDRRLYEEYESSARERMISRDVDDWPIVATSLLLKRPV